MSEEATATRRSPEYRQGWNAGRQYAMRELSVEDHPAFRELKTFAAAADERHTRTWERLREARAEVDALERRIAYLEQTKPCDACDGTGRRLVSKLEALVLDDEALPSSLPSAGTEGTT